MFLIILNTVLHPPRPSPSLNSSALVRIIHRRKPPRQPRRCFHQQTDRALCCFDPVFKAPGVCHRRRHRRRCSSGSARQRRVGRRERRPETAVQVVRV
jgi:hypothetical protein